MPFLSSKQSLSAPIWLLFGVLLIWLGASGLREGVWEFRIRLMSGEAMRSVEADSGALTNIVFFTSIADRHPNNSVLGEIAYQAASYVALASDDPEPLFERFGLISRGEAQLERTPTDTFTWFNHAQAAALAFLPSEVKDPAMEAYRLSMAYGTFEGQLFLPRSLFCLSYGDTMEDEYYQLCEKQLSIFEKTQNRNFNKFRRAYVDGFR